MIIGLKTNNTVSMASSTGERFDWKKEEDPFRVRLRFTPTDYVKMVVCGIFIVPLRSVKLV